MRSEFEALMRQAPDLVACLVDLERALDVLCRAFQTGGKLLVCGNGGSAADSEHIVGELMKGFDSQRRLAAADREQFVALYPGEGEYLADRLQGALPALSLASQTSLLTAVANDVAGDMVYAQQVYGYGRRGDVLLAISTSGNSSSVLQALRVARVLGLATIGLTGRDGGAMAGLCDVLLRVPRRATSDIQGGHQSLYHTLCSLLEKEFFPT